MANNKNADQLKAFYTELSKIAKSDDWQNILKVAKKILGISVNDKKAFHCKIVCLIQLGKFDEALTSIQRFPTELNDFYFERAYCEYRLNQIEDALKTLKSCPNLTYKEKELLAQVNYRLENYEESYELYRDIIKTHQDDFDLNRQTNLAAVVCALNNSKPSAKKNLDMNEYEDQTYELCYNSACLSISKGKYDEAENKLKKAEEMCKEFYQNEEDFDESELESELAIIKIQLAYCLQNLNKNEEALKIYNNVLKNKQGDLSAIAVASNNIVTLNNDQNIFDSKKRIKTATSSELEHKLTSKQKYAIALNEILLALTASQNDLVHKLLAQFKTKYNETEDYVMLKASQFIKEKKIHEAEKILKLFCETNKSCSITIRYYLIQTLVTQGKLNDTVNVLKSIDGYYNHPDVVNALVAIYNSLNKPDEASELLNNATDYFLKENPNGKEIDVYLKENIQYQIKLKKWDKAAELLETLRKRNQSDTKILSQLIGIYSKFKPEKAKELSAQLPPFESLLDNVDIDSLESQFNLLSTKYSKSKAEAKTLKSGDVTTADLVKKKKNKKKKKIKLPKNYDPNIALDAERWLPLRERSYYKGKRKKKGQSTVGKGTQGAVSSEQPPQSPKASSISSPQAVSPTTAVIPPKQKLSASQQKKKKKGGSKW